MGIVKQQILQLLLEYPKNRDNHGRFTSGGGSAKGMGLVDKDGNIHSVTIVDANKGFILDTVNDWGKKAIFGSSWESLANNESNWTQWGYKIKAVKTSDGKTQSLILYTKKENGSLYVSQLESNPNNRKGKGLRGAGSTALAVACSELSEGKKLYLIATPSSVPFYKKMGFTKNKDQWEFSYEQAQSFAKVMGVIK